MVKRYEISGSTANGSYETDLMDPDHSECELSSITFFDGSGQQVTPSAGTVVFTGTPDGQNYRDIHDGSFNAASAYDPARTAPYAEGLMVKAKLTLSGVVGAVTFKAVAWRR